MATQITQPNFSIRFNSAKLGQPLRVLKFKGEEAISRPYCFTIDCVSEDDDLDLNSFLHQPAFLAFDEAGAGVHGIVSTFSQGQNQGRFTHYQLKLVPQLDCLRHRINQRIFQQQTVAQIIGTVLAEHNILADRFYFNLQQRDESPRDFCTQYKESDLHFIQRLCEEEGIFWYFRHEPQKHTLIFGDHMMAFNKLPEALRYLPDSGQVAEETVINHFSVGVQTATSRVTFRDYEFQTPRQSPEGKSSWQSTLPAPAGPDLEHFVYPGLFSQQERGGRLATRMLERHQVNAQQASGTSDHRLLISGHCMTLQAHPRKSWNDRWLLIATEHTGKQPQVLEERSSASAAQGKDDFQQGYRNSFTAMPWLGNYRPPLEHPKPLALVSQTATVCGPAGEEIYCDAYGRVQVRFRWDRSGSVDGRSSCWIRVASGWAGNGYGAITIPRIGMEVVVTFEEGDPDRPLITGCLFNELNQPPYELPAHKTRSVFKSLSSLNGGGSNELHIEDRQGAEQIYVHAQRDMQSHVRNDNRLEVGNEQRTTINGNSLTEVRGEESHTTVGPRKTQINADDYLNVLGSSNIQAAQAIAVGAGQQVHIQAGAQVVIEAGASLTLKAGGQHLLVTSAGIFSSTPILPGGSPSAGVGMGLGVPQLPGETAAQAAGRMLSIIPAPGLTLKGWTPEPEPEEPLPEAAVCEDCLHKAYEKFEPLIAR